MVSKKLRTAFGLSAVDALLRFFSILIGQEHGKSYSNGIERILAFKIVQYIDFIGGILENLVVLAY